MVKLEEVADENFTKIGEEDDEDYTDTDSSISSEDDLSDAESIYEGESITERIAALKDIIPPTTRRTISSTVSTLSSYTWSGLQFGGNAFWIFSTSLMLFGVPFAVAMMEEQQYMEMEREQKMREVGNEVITPGLSSSNDAKPAL